MNTRRSRAARSWLIPVVLVVAAACSSGDDAGPPTSAAPSPTTAAPSPTTVAGSPATVAPATTATVAPPPSTLALAPGSRYVAMGSSYAAGSGIPDQIDAPCGRSDANYPSLVAAALGLRLVDVSCGGATTDNLIDTPQNGLAPQIDALTADTGLVSVTAGGNDLGYVGIAGTCGLGETPCTVDEADLQRKATALVANLRKLFDAIRQRSPKATIVFVTYPRMVTDTACPALDFEPAEAAAFAKVATALEDAFLTAAADQSGLILVDPYRAAGDHGACAPDGESWITGNAPAEGAGYHPTAAEHVAVSKLIVQALGR